MRWLPVPTAVLLCCGVAAADSTLDLAGALRVRTAALYNLDLDRGLDASGDPAFAVPAEGGQTLTHADLRLRTDLAFRAPAAGVTVHARIDVLDDVALGADADGPAATTLSQRPPEGAFLIRRAYGEAETALGVIAAGRIGSHWGMGLFTNGGDCADCNFGDSADRLAFATALAGHAWELAYDLSASGPTGARADGRAIDLARDDNTRTLRMSMLRSFGETGLARRLRAEVSSVEYGAYYAYRTQEREAVTTAGGIAMVPRGLRAHVVDGWFRFTHPVLRVEAEAAVIRARIEQPSMVPGVLLRMPLRALQVGAALRSEVGAADATWAGGLDAGYASGDPTPGFGAFPRPGAAPMPGDLDGAQADGITDARADNFRFHPDFQVDRILFREILGTVTDAAYLRPHVRFRTRALGAGVFTAELAAIASIAVEPSSTPSGQRPLGIEIDPTLAYVADDGFTIAVAHGTLFPLAGLDNPARGLTARTAHAIRLHLGYAF